MPRHPSHTALAACTTLAACSIPAPAALIVHDNSALTFTWTRSVLPPSGPLFEGRALDPTLPAAQQSGVHMNHAFHWLGYEPTSSLQLLPEDLAGVSPAARVARAPEPVPLLSENFYPAAAFAPGSLVGPGELWEAGAMGYSEGFTTRAWFLGPEATVGIRFSLAGSTHYGWITLGLQPGITPHGHYQPVAWAYESTPDTPALVIPAPSCALLGLLALAPRRRRP